MSHSEEFLRILSVLLSGQPPAEPSLPEAGAPHAVCPDPPAPAQQSEQKPCRRVRS
jgi:hypothetical protein